MILNDDIKQKIIDHAEKVYPRECCGVIIENAGKHVYYPCRNVAENDNQFVIDPKDYLVASNLGTIVAIVHSHPDATPKPSQADMAACEKTNLPWFIVGYPNKMWNCVEPSGYKPPLIGRSWEHGILDCYTIIKDWYEYEKGISIPDFDRRDEWWKKGENLYRENFAKAGFYRLEPGTTKEVGDVILMQIKSNVPNHGAIYLGNNQVLHHLFNRLSCREVYGGYFKKHTSDVLRYGG